MQVRHSPSRSALAARATGSPSRLRDLFTRKFRGLFIGSVLEWFDWNTFLILSSVFAHEFFPGDHPYLDTLIVFAGTFAFRPLGGILLGYISDTRGRRWGLVWSSALMPAGSLLLAVAPTYGIAGMFAPVVLIFARSLQGLSTGGEFSSFIAYLAENAPKSGGHDRSRGAEFTSFAYMTSTLGVLLGLAAGFILGKTSHSALVWDWRIPFAVAAAVGIYGLYWRLRLTETDEFNRVLAIARPDDLAGARDGHVARRSALQATRDSPRSFLRVVGFTLASTVVYYAIVVYIPSHGVGNQAAWQPVTTTAFLIAVATDTLLIGALIPLGWWADRVGRLPLLITFSAGYAILAVPLARLYGSPLWGTVTVQVVAVLLFGCYAAAGPIAMAEMFETQFRSTGLGLPYSITVAIFGGTVPLLLYSHWVLVHLFPWYVTVLSLASLATYLVSWEEPRGQKMGVASNPLSVRATPLVKLRRWVRARRHSA
jgi:MFS transporter, MHS family, alpha-ketoglutarate permease